MRIRGSTIPRLNLTPLLDTYHIRSKQAAIIPFRANWAQRQLVKAVEDDYAEGRPSRFVILKARQIGVSTAIQLIEFSCCIALKNSNCVVVAHRADSSEHLFGISKLNYETWEYGDFFPARYSTRRELVFDGQGSSIRVMTADKPDVGRGRTISYLHASELAFWRLPVETMIGFAQSIPDLPGTGIFVESTANGVGNYFEELWDEAKTASSTYTPFFFPWFKHHEYLPCFGIYCENGTCKMCMHRSKGLKPQNEEEKRLLRLGASPAHVAWRRDALPSKFNGDESFFNQEMPSTPEDAFISSGVNAFSPDLLKEVFKPVEPWRGKLVRNASGNIEFVKDAHGPLRVFKPPSTNQEFGSYFIGADPCNGTSSGDWAAAQVINRHTKEQVAVWHGRINPVPFAEELARLGTYYNYAMVAPDIMGGGAATLGSLTHLYHNIWQHKNPDKWPGQERSRSLGFLGSWNRKQWMIAKLADYVERQQILIHDVPTYREMRAYVYYGSKGWGDVYGPATRDGYDDLVCALAIACLCESTEDPPPKFQVAPSPDEKGIVYGKMVDMSVDPDFEPWEEAQ